MVFWAVLVASAVLLAVFWFRRGKGLPPGPLGFPVIGFLPRLDPKNPHLTLTKLSKEYGGIYSLQLGSVFTVVLSDPGLIREALSLPELAGRAPLYLTHGIMSGNGIICADGEKWKEQRKFVTSNLRLFGMVKFGKKKSKIEWNIKKGLEDLRRILERSSEAVDTERVLMHVLGNVVFDLVFGKTWEEDDETWKRLLSYQEEGTKLIGVAGPINFLPFLRFLPKYREVLRYVKEGINDTHHIYQTILEEYRKSEPEEEPSHFLGAFDREMRRRVADPGNYTPVQFNFLMADLWGAGVDTTMTTLRWFFLFMAKHRHFQEEVQKEIDQVVGGEELVLSDMPNLPYLQACISETQRIRSVTPLGFPHGALQNAFLVGYRIPKGSMVIPLQWAVHMNPVYHPAPEAFNPNRFIGEDGKFKKMAAFIPFQTGKRVCLGEEFAKMLLFLFGGGVLQKFFLTVDDHVCLDGDVGITLTPKPHKINFAARG